MNGAQIENALRSDKFVNQCFIGVFAADQLPIKEFPGALVVNTDTSSQPGQHWVAFFLVNDTIECFDSYGEHPGNYSAHIAQWLNDTFNVVQCETLQSRNSTVCGQYCMYFILLMSYGFMYEDVMSSMTKNGQVNDKFV